jgi:hypothetical protein
MCDIINYRPNGKDVSSGEYIMKGTRGITMQSYGLPSGLYGFINNQQAQHDINGRIKEGQQPS